MSEITDTFEYNSANKSDDNNKQDDISVQESDDILCDTQTLVNTQEVSTPPAHEAPDSKVSSSVADMSPSTSVFPTLKNEALMADWYSVKYSPVFFNPSEFIQTASGNKVALNSILCGSHKIHMAGRSIIHPGVILRGDLSGLKIGKYVSIGKGSTLTPPIKSGDSPLGYIPITIGDYVIIGENCVISAASIANRIIIGNNCIIGKRCILKDNCLILPGTVLPPDTVVPSLTAFGGAPGRFLGDLYESTPFSHRKHAKSVYDKFLSQTFQ